jgi:DNA-binding NarL/FixJ family response regulator
MMVKNRAGKNKSRIVIVDDHAIVREGLAQMINDSQDLTVCAQAEDAGGAMDAVKAHQPDLVIVDLSLHGKPGMELIKDLHASDVNLPVLVLSMHDEDLYAERVLRAGARGYIMKQEATDKIIDAIRHVLSGEICVSKKVADRLLGRLTAGNSRRVGSSMERLSDRELEVFSLIGQGKAVREIAEALNLSVKTVESHREHIKNKLGLGSSTELLRLAIQTALDEK